MFSCDLMSCRLVEICDVGDLELTQLVAHFPYYVENLRSEKLIVSAKINGSETEGHPVKPVGMQIFFA